MTDDPRFAPTAEADLVLSGDAILGTVPPELTGTLVRNGPADLRLTDHEFDGDGMLRTLTFGPDEVRYRAKYIETIKRVAERDSPTPKFREFGTQVPGGPLTNMEATRDANAANTSVMRQGDCYLALWEAGTPARSTLRPWRRSDRLISAASYRRNCRSRRIRSSIRRPGSCSTLGCISVHTPRSSPTAEIRMVRRTSSPQIAFRMRCSTTTVRSPVSGWSIYSARRSIRCCHISRA